MSIPSLNFTRRLGYENLEIKQQLGVKFMIKTLTEMPLLETILRVSSINLLISNDKRIDKTESRLREVHLNPNLQNRILRFEQQEGVGVVFNRQAALLLIHLSRHYCSANTPPNSLKHLDLNLGLLFLLANDFLTFIEDLKFKDNDLDHNLRLMAPHITRQYLFNHSYQERYLVPQSWLIFEGLKDKAKAHNFIDLSAILKETRGFTLDEYFTVLTILYCYWGRLTFEKWEHKYIIIDPEVVFEKIKIPKEKYLKILDSLSVKVCPTAKHPDLKNILDWKKEIYEYFELRLKPLIKIDNRYVCSDIEFVKSAFWNGPYHMILTDYPQTPIAKKMMNFLGDTTEFFVRAVGKDAFKEKFKDIINGNGHPLGDGVIEINKDWIVIIESKAARPGIEIVSGDKPITELNDFKKLLKDGITQLNDRISEYREHDKFTGRITPILITAGHVPQHEIIWDFVMKELGKLSIMNDKKTDFPFVMDLEAWNVICAAEKAKIHISEILTARYKNDSVKTSSPSYFLFRLIFNDQTLQEPLHPELFSLFEDRMEGLTTKLFEKIFKKRTTTTGIWKPIFDLQQ
jgi:hypothetical protein